MFGMLFLGGNLFIMMEIRGHKEVAECECWLEVGQMLRYCKGYTRETRLLLRGNGPYQHSCTYSNMLPFALMNKSWAQLYYSIQVRLHLSLSKKWNATETWDHPRGCVTAARRARQNIREGKRCLKTRIIFHLKREGSFNLDRDHWQRRWGGGKWLASSLQLKIITCNYTSNF